MLMPQHVMSFTSSDTFRLRIVIMPPCPPVRSTVSVMLRPSITYVPDTAPAGP